MIATLQNSTARMFDLFVRLSQHNKSRAEDPRPVVVSALIEGIAAAKRASHPIIVSAMPYTGPADPYDLNRRCPILSRMRSKPVRLPSP